MKKQQLQEQYIGEIKSQLQQDFPDRDHEELMEHATYAFNLLISELGKRRRWVNITQEKFEKHFPKWREEYPARTAWVIRNPKGLPLRFDIYYHEAKKKHTFTRLMYSLDRHVVLPDWHIRTLRGLSRNRQSASSALTKLLYVIGDQIAASLRNREGVWADV